MVHILEDIGVAQGNPTLVSSLEGLLLWRTAEPWR